MDVRHVVSGVALACLCAASVAATGNASADFSASQNPNGPWSYGWSDGLNGTFVSFELSQQNPAGMDYWYLDRSGGIGAAPGYPFVGRNATDTELSLSTATVQPFQLVLHPGSLGEYAVLRWTAPADQVVRLTADYAGIDFVGPTTSDVHVLINGLNVYSGELATNADRASFSTQSLDVAKGATVDFAVGYGTNRTFFFDSTGLDVTIAPVPEPSTLWLFALGCPVLVWLRQRRRA